VHCISAFKIIHGIQQLLGDQWLFKTLLAKARIKVKHYIGLLKTDSLVYMDCGQLLEMNTA
jgi:hypothetical protein